LLTIWHGGHLEFEPPPDILNCMTEIAIESQGNHEYVVRIPVGDDADDEVVESWFRITPDVLARLGVEQGDEQRVVVETVAFISAHQALIDFPQTLELEDAIAAYPDFVRTVRKRLTQSSAPPANAVD
jgi:hypothetical protein